MAEASPICREAITKKQERDFLKYQLQCLPDVEYVIEPTKTTSGKRVLLMAPEVYACFKTILKKRKERQYLLLRYPFTYNIAIRNTTNIPPTRYHYEHSNFWNE